LQKAKHSKDRNQLEHAKTTVCSRLGEPELVSGEKQKKPNILKV